MRILTTSLLVLALAACSGSPAGPAGEPGQTAAFAQCSEPAPLNGTPDPRGPDRYIVVFKDGTDADAATARLAQKYGFAPRHVYRHALLGFSSTLTDTQLAGVRCEPETRYVEHDRIFSIAG